MNGNQNFNRKNNYQPRYRIVNNNSQQASPQRQNKTSGLKAFLISFGFIALICIAFIAKNEYQKKKAQDLQNIASGNFDDIELDIDYINPDEVSRKIRNKNAQLIDIREPEEFDAKHIESSINLPLSQVEQKIALIDQVKEVIIIDREESQIGKGFADHLKSQGVNVKYLEGGILNYSQSGYNLVSMGNPTLTEDLVKVSSVSGEEIIDQIKEGKEYVFLDVRPELQFTSDNIDGSMNIPLEKLEEKKLDIPFGSILVYDSDSIRSFQAAVRLNDMNIYNVYNSLDSYEQLKAKLLEAAQQAKENTEPPAQPKQQEQ